MFPLSAGLSGRQGPAGATWAVEDDADLLLGRMLLAGGPADVSHETLGRRLRRVGFLSHAHSSGGDDEGIVTLSEIGPIWTIDQEAKSLKVLASTLADFGKFRSISLNVTTPP